MLQIRNILYPTDFSPYSDAAFPYALYFARRHHATIHMMHVAPAVGLHPVPDTFDTVNAEGRFEQGLRDEADAQMDALVGAHKAGDVALTRIYTPHLTPADVLLKYAEAKDVDLIVMGSHGRSGVRRLLLGSVAEEMMRRASCPLLVARRQEGPVWDTMTSRRVLVPFDFSAPAEHALRYAHELAALFDVPLDVIHVIDPGTDLDEYVSEVADQGSALGRLTEKARQSLVRIRADIDEPAIEVSYKVLVGYPPREITEFALRTGAGMIILSSHGQTGKRSIMIGKVAEHIVRNASCPVFIARPFGKSLVLDSETAGNDEKVDREGVDTVQNEPSPLNVPRQPVRN